MATINLLPNGDQFMDLSDEPSSYPNPAVGWNKINDDNDNTYVIANPNYTNYGRFYLTDLPGASAISNVTVYGRCKRTQIGYVYLGIYIGSTYYGMTLQTLTESWASYSENMGGTNPATGVAWTLADINNLVAAIQLSAYYNDWAQCAKLWVEITYTPAVAPTVTTQAATNVLITSCTGNGNITATGGENCTRRGFCYKVGTSGDPTTVDSVVYDDGSFGVGAYTKAITGLSPGTGYRVRAYAVNSVGTGYGATVQVTTLTAFIRLHTASAQRRYKASTFSTFTFPDPAGTGFTAATDGYSMLAGWGVIGAIQVFLSGTLNFAGGLGRKTRKSLEGSLTSSGTVSHFFRFYKVLYGTLNFSGSLSGLRKMVIGGVLNLSGTLNRLIKKSLVGTLNSAGGLIARRFQVLAGTLNFSGALASVYRFSKSLTGTLNLSGSLIKLVKKNLAGVLNSSGTLGRKIWHKLSGTLNSSGILTYGMGLVYKALAGTLNMSGNLNRKIRKSLSGTVSFIGSLLSFFSTFFVHRYVIEIHNSAGTLLAILKNAYGIKLEETVNAPKTLTFKCPADEPNLVYLTRGNEIWVRDVKNNVVLAKTKLLRDDDTR